METILKDHKVDLDLQTCDCKDFIFRRRHFKLGDDNRLCKHLKEVVKDTSPIIKVLHKKRYFKRIDAMRAATLIYKDLDKFLKSLINIEVCGSFRRESELVSDLDILLNIDTSVSIYDIYDHLESTGNYKVIMKGTKRTSYIFMNTIQIDLKVVPTTSWAFALLHYTGSKEHNIILRSQAKKLGYSLNEYELKGYQGVIRTETEIFKALNMEYKKPNER